MYAIEKTKNSAAGVPVLLAFTFFMGLMLSRLIAMVLGFKNGPELIMTAFGGTAGVFFVMASLSSVIKRDLSGMGKWLFVGALAILVGGIINVFVGSSAGMMVISVAGHRHLQRLHAVRPEADRGRRRDQLHQRHAGPVPGHVQRVPEPAGPAGHHGRRARLKHCDTRTAKKGPSGPFFVSGAR
jgi:hypothetical protein